MASRLGRHVVAGSAWPWRACPRPLPLPSSAGLCAASVDGRRPYAVLLFGTDSISAAFLDHLWRHRNVPKAGGAPAVAALEVVCPPDQWIDRGRSRFSRAPVKERALELGLRVHDAPPGHRLEGFHVPVQASGAPFDLAVVVSFGYFLTAEVLRSFKHGAFNFHPSLLPKYRGASPLQTALMNGDRTTGMTVLEISPRAWDAGRILLQHELPIPDKADYGVLASLVQRDGPPMMLDALVRLDELLATARPQSSVGVSHARKITTATARVDFMHRTATEIARLHRAIRHHHHVHTLWQGRELLLHELSEAAELPPGSRPGPAEVGFAVPPGTVFFDAGPRTFVVACAGDTWLSVAKLQLENRKALSAWDFVNGYRLPKTGVAMVLGQ